MTSWNQSSPALWSSAIIMLIIVALLYLWEEAVVLARARLPATLMPVVDSMLAEMGGLGFIGLFLSMIVINGPLGHVVEHVSEEYLGNGEILLETFEFLHTAFFETAIAFFVVAGLTVFRTLVQVESLADVSTAVFDLDGDGNVSCTELADFLNVQSTLVDSNQDGVLNEEEIALVMRTATRPSLWDEIFMTTDRIRAEALVVRERFVQTCKVGTDFKIENYFGRVFGHNLEEIVELSPLTWLPLVPAISLGRTVDMSRNVVSASSENAYLSCGQFLGSPAFFTVSTISVVLAAVWSAWNFYKMKQIKDMILPILVKCGKQQGGGEAQLLPPRYASPELFEQFNSSPGIIGAIESFFAVPARNRQEALFGVAGAAGPALYRNSIKFHSWFVVSQIVFWGLQIVARDAEAVYFGWNVGNPDLLLPELVIFGAYVVCASLQLALAPQTFLNYCLVTTIEELVVDKWIYRDDVTTMKKDDINKVVLEPKQPSFSPVTSSDS
jgi:hypothetical protein